VNLSKLKASITGATLSLVSLFYLYSRSRCFKLTI